MKTTKNEAVKLVADAALLYQNKVLLVKYTDTNKYDHQKGWFLPDDLLRFNEHPGDGIRRIVKEQTGIEVPGIKLDHIESFTGNDGSWHLVFHFAAVLDALPEFKTDSNISSCTWFDAENLPDEREIAHHGWAKYTIETILSKFNNK